MSKKISIIYDDEEDESESECVFNIKTNAEPKPKIIIEDENDDEEHELNFKVEYNSEQYKSEQYKSEQTRKKNFTIKKINSNSNNQCQSCPNCEINTELLYLVRELSRKINTMENDIAEMKQLVKKRGVNQVSVPPMNKKNVIEWLNNYIIPTITFDEFVENLVVTMGHFEFLLEYKLTDTIQKIIQTNIVKSDDVIYPMYSTTEKSGKVYVFNENETWEVITIEYLSKFVKQIENKLSQHCIELKNRYSGKNNFNSQLQDQCQQAILKLYNISYTQDATMNRVRYDLCVQLKTVIRHH